VDALEGNVGDRGGAEARIGGASAPRGLKAAPQGAGVARELHQVVFELVEERLLFGLVFGGEGVAELLEEFALFAGDFAGCADFNADHEVAAAAAVDEGDAAVFEAEGLSALDAFGDLQSFETFEGEDVDLSAE